MKNNKQNTRSLLPVSIYQKRFFFEWLLEPNSSAYNTSLVFKMDNALDLGIIKKSLAHYVKENEVMHARYSLDGKCCYYGDYTIEDFYEELDLPSENILESKLNDLLYKPFDLTKDVLIRFYLLKSKTDKKPVYYLAFVLQHIIADAEMAVSMIKQVETNYNNLRSGKELQYGIVKSFSKAVFEEQRFLTNLNKESSQKFWLDFIGDTPHSIDLPYQKKDTLVENKKGHSIYFDLDKGQKQQLKAYARSQRTTTFIVLSGVFGLLLSKYSGMLDFMISYPINMRHRNYKGVTGCFVNNIPMRFNVGVETFAELLTQLSNQRRVVKPHTSYTLTEIIQDQRKYNDLDHNHFFNVGITQTNLNQLPLNLEGVLTSPINVPFGTDSIYEIGLLYDEYSSDNIKFSLEYREALFEESFMQDFVETFQRTLKSLISGEVYQLNEVSIVSPQAYQTIVYDWNATDVTYPKEETVVSLFEAQVKATPNQIALVYEGKKLTYKQLNEKSNQLALEIRKTYKTRTGKDLQSGTLIALCLGRSLEMVIGILGVLKAGGAYVPMDPGYPKERIDFMLEDTASIFILTQKNIAKDQLAYLPREQLLLIDLAQPFYGINLVSNLAITIEPKDLSYIIYTSGTTGTPKGVMVEHVSIYNTIVSLNPLYKGYQRATSYTSYIFDVSISEIFNSLTSGLTLYILSDMMRKDVKALSAYIDTQNIELLYLPPVVLSQLEKNDYSSLKALIYAGEPCDASTITYWSSKVSLYNYYGPTENSVYATCKKMSANTIFQIGKPIANTKAYVLDSLGLPVPVGVIGELYLGGGGLSKGYLNRDDLTKERFITNPFTTQAEKDKGYTRMYKTGDLVRWLSDGNLEYMGRNDDQVKIRGYRIELAEIETVLSGIEGVTDSCVLAKERTNDSSTGKYLVGYYIVSEAAAGISSGYLLELLSKHLPDYMIPSALIAMEAFPMTVNGKLDKRALPEPEFNTTENYVAPQTALEIAFCAIWSSVLDIDKVGITDHFFRIGGSSILAMQLVHKINEQQSIEVKVSDLFEFPTIKQLLEHITQEKSVEIPKRSLSISPLSFSQQRLWFIESYEGGTNAYHMPLVFEVLSITDISLFERAIQSVIRRHEVLRSVFAKGDNDQWQQLVCQDSLAINHHRCDVFEYKSLLQSTIDNPFNLENEYPIRVCFYEVSNKDEVIDRYVLILMHHIASDGWSIEVFVRELNSYYTAYESGDTDFELPALAIQYSDYAAWELNALTESVLSSKLAYWESHLSGYEILSLPTDFARPSEFDYKGNSFSFVISEKLSAQLRNLTQSHGVTLYSVFLSSIAILLGKYSNQDDILIGSPHANRGHYQTNNLIGFFINTVVNRIRLNKDQRFIDLIDQVYQGQVDSLAHQDFPFEQLLDHLSIERDTSRHPLFQVLFSLQSFGAKEMEALSEYIEPVSLEENYQIEKFDLSIFMDDSSEAIAVQFSYASSLFSEETIARLAKHYLVLLESLVEDVTTPYLSQSLLDTLSYQTMVYDWNATDVTYPKEETVVSLFEAQVKATPNQIALVHEEKELTYKQLNEKSNQLAVKIRKTYNDRTGESLQADTLIALCLDRSLEMVIGILGVLKAGGAYVSIDTKYPKDRIDFILEDTGSVLILSQECIVEDLLSYVPKERILLIDLSNYLYENEEKENLEVPIYCNSLLTAIYTSGTTGKPKGVLIEHHTIHNTVNDLLPVYASISNATVYTSYVFDVSIFEIFSSLISGSMLHVLSDNVRLNAELLSTYLIDNAINLCYLPPVLLKNLPIVDYQNLNYILYAGEPCDALTAEKWASKVNLWNYYGPTEASICVSKKILSSEVNLIGKPIQNTTAYVLDTLGKPVAVGVVGELYIGGAGVARGYLNREELTQERFIENPFATELAKEKRYTRMYKTGDLVRWLPDGDLEYIGRNDDQVKIRGYRIELAEIEAVLLDIEGISQSCVLAKERTTNSEVSKYLVSYFVASETAVNISSEYLREVLSKRLPDYMIPSAFVGMDKFPMTVNGKLDKRALPDPEFNILENYVAPQTILEIALCAIWSSVLGIEKTGITDDFFKVGGNSILAIKLVSEIRKTLKKDITVKQLFLHGTIKKFTASLIQSKSASKHFGEVVNLEKESFLNVDLSSINRLVRFSEDPKNVLLTGSTGFVGVFLLQDLLIHTKVNVYCLVRAENILAGKQKIWNQFNLFGLKLSEYEDRIIPVLGDLAKINLGIHKEQYHFLEESIDYIYHAATHMDHFSSYSRLKKANVGGMKEIIKMATAKMLKKVIYLSTIDGLKKTSKEKDSREAEIHYSNLGYSSSKWVGEDLLVKAKENGLPVQIYRLGLVTSTVENYNIPDGQWFTQLLKSCVNLGFYPERITFSILPLDFVSKTIIQMSLKQHVASDIFHLCNPNLIGLEHLLNGSFSEIEKISLKDWLVKLKSRIDDLETLPIIKFIDFEMEEINSIINEESNYNPFYMEIPSTKHTEESVEKEINMNFPKEGMTFI